MPSAPRRTTPTAKSATAFSSASRYPTLADRTLVAGWNFRDPSIGSPQSFVRLDGSYVPFASTRQARTRAGDTRRSIEERYEDRGDSLEKIRKAAQKLVADGFLLAGDIDAIAARAAEH